MSAIEQAGEPSLSEVAAAYDPSEVPVSDRMLNLVEAPQGAMALLAGLRRQREGGPLHSIVHVPERVLGPVVFFFMCCTSM